MLHIQSFFPHSLILFREDIYVHVHETANLYPYVSVGGWGGLWGCGATLHELLNLNVMHGKFYSWTFICPLFADALYKCNGTKTHFSSVQLKMVSIRARKSPYALHPVSQKFLQRCL